jgi:hypothetical protein
MLGELLQPCQREFLNTRNYVAKFDVLARLRLSFEEFDQAIRCFLADGDAIWNSDQVGVLKLHSGALSAIVEQHLKPRTLQVFVELLASFTQTIILHVRYRDDHIKGREAFWPDDTVRIVVLFYRRGNDALNSDAITWFFWSKRKSEAGCADLVGLRWQE